MRIFSVLMFEKNLKRFNRNKMIVKMLTWMRLAEIIGEFILIEIPDAIIMRLVETR